MTEFTSSVSEETGTLTGRGGLQLFTRCWRSSPDLNTPLRAVVALVHGISEHSGRYTSIVAHLSNNAFAVCAFDLRGHGRSDGRRGHIDDWSEYREDLRTFVDGVHSKFPDLPVFLYGHSLGALIVAEYILWYPEGLAGVVVSGIPIKPTGAARPPLVLLARSLSRIWPTFSVSLGVDGTRLSRDPVMVRDFDQDPLAHHHATARWGTATLNAIDRLRSRESEIRLPILILHGEADPVNSVEGSRELFANVSSSKKKLRVYPGGMHEPHNDIQREQVVRDVEQWLTGELESLAADDAADSASSNRLA